MESEDLQAKDSHSTHIIAEMACSHEGDPILARKIIDGAGEAGVDAIQFQVWSLKNMVVPHHPDYAKLERLELSYSDWEDLSNYVRNRHASMQIIGCVYECESVDFFEKINVDAYKIHSSDLSNPHLIECVASTGRRIDLSVGASTIFEISEALELIRRMSDSEIWMMYGYQGFPTPTDAIHLNYMMKLRDLFELRVGYQDHSDADSDAAFWLPAAAIGMGVDVLEKHITHDRSLGGIDHEAALNPDEFAKFMNMVREIEHAKGNRVPRPFSEEEITYRRYSKKSLVAARNLSEGTIISGSDLIPMRADSLGLPPNDTHRLVERRLKRPIAAYQLVKEEDVT